MACHERSYLGVGVAVGCDDAVSLNFFKISLNFLANGWLETHTSSVKYPGPSQLHTLNHQALKPCHPIPMATTK